MSASDAGLLYPLPQFAVIRAAMSTAWMLPLSGGHQAHVRAVGVAAPKQTAQQIPRQRPLAGLTETG